MNVKPYSLDDKFDEISSGIDNLYGCLHILKIYTEYKMDSNIEIANINILVSKLIEDINALSRCL